MDALQAQQLAVQQYPAESDCSASPVRVPSAQQDSPSSWYRCVAATRSCRHWCGRLHRICQEHVHGIPKHTSRLPRHQRRGSLYGTALSAGATYVAVIASKCLWLPGHLRDKLWRLWQSKGFRRPRSSGAMQPSTW